MALKKFVLDVSAYCYEPTMAWLSLSYGSTQYIRVNYIARPNIVIDFDKVVTIKRIDVSGKLPLTTTGGIAGTFDRPIGSAFVDVLLEKAFNDIPTGPESNFFKRITERYYVNSRIDRPQDLNLVCDRIEILDLIVQLSVAATGTVSGVSDDPDLSLILMDVYYEES